MRLIRTIERLNPYGTLAVTFLIIGVVTTFLPTEPLKDERFYFPLIKVFGESYLSPIHSIKTMNQSMGPLYFIFYGFIGQFTEYSITVLRNVNVFISFLTVVALFKILTKFSRHPLCLTLWFTINPYFLFLTTPLLYTDNLCMFFVLLGMYFYLVQRNIFVSGLLWALALWTRQTAIIIPLAALLTEFYISRGKISLKLFNLGMTTLPFLAFIILIVLWDFNLTSPNTVHKVNSISTFDFSLKKLTYAILLSGVYSAPLWLPRIREIMKHPALYIAVASTLLLFIDFPRVINKDGYLGVWTSGIFDKLLVWLDGFAFVLVPLIWIPSFAFFLLLAISTTKSRANLFSILTVLLFFMFQAIYTYSWDKYFILIIPALLIAGSGIINLPGNSVKSR
jgi:hypothetical protein